MGTPVTLALFLVSTAVALAASSVLIVRLERIGARLSLAEAALGVVAALAADLPEISTAIAALVQGQNEVGVGVILGSNVAKLALLLGLAAVVAGRVRLDRRVVLLESVVAGVLALVTVAVVGGGVAPAPGLVVALLVFVPYVVLTGLRPEARARLPIPSRLRGTLTGATDAGGGRPRHRARTRWRYRRRRRCLGALSSWSGRRSSLERTGSDLGTAWDISDLVVGAVLLAIVTSIPNAVAAVHLARRGRGAATLSTTTNSNNINVVVGLLVPAAILGLGTVTSAAVLAAWWYLGLTAAVLAWAFLRRGLTRLDGVVIGIAYAVFVVLLVR